LLYIYFSPIFFWIKKFYKSLGVSKNMGMLDLERQKLALVWGEPRSTRCIGTDSYQLPKNHFPNGVEVTEYYQDKELKTTICRFMNKDHCVANELFSKNEVLEVICKYALNEENNSECKEG
jgi:hypothetical protein